MEDEEEKSIDNLKEMIEDNLKKFTKEDINLENIETLYKLVDIYKDLENVDYWKKEEENMYGRYNDGSYSRDFSGEYGRQGMRGTGPYSRYREGRYSGGRGSGRYRGDDIMDDMEENYSNYNESRNYGAEGEAMKSLDYMLKSVHQFMKMLKEDAGSQEEMQMIQEYARKIGDM